MAIISTQQFRANLKKLNLDTMAELVAQTFAYCLWHYHKDGQKTPYLDMQAAAGESRSVLADMIRQMKLGQRIKGFANMPAEEQERACTTVADVQVACAFADAKAKKEQRKLARTEKKAAAPKVETPAPEQEPAAPAPEAAIVVDGECEVVTMPESCLVIGGEVVQLSSGEADALYDTLMALRNQMMAAPLRLAA